ncbi:hypothetical protein JOF53_003125 [Crossiella equi]|uniref:SUKH-3 immunity protein n=1 Tax=Crossiella equi TaxID=130796 RepID=A0ABS5ACE4_9PSEU|nr:SUKH-3 domain-containing protein [Crossiella equi]MBP2474253.1 hypothetical protein [Crossiella equi]
MNERPAIAMLKKAGWFPGRRVSAERDISVLQSEGYSLFPKAEEFLAEFTGLRLEIENESQDEIFFSAAYVCESMFFFEWSVEYSQRAGVRMIPAGVAEEYLTLLVGEDGRWFGGFDGEFGLLGDDIFEAIDSFVTNPSDFKQRL